MVGLRLVDVLLGDITDVVVDQKLFDGDRFDDLTTIDAVGHCERVQIKHFVDHGAPLTIDVFSGDRRGLRLDHLVRAIALDLRRVDRPRESAYRIILNLSAPSDTRLTRILVPCHDAVRPFVYGMQTVRYQFSFEQAASERDANPLAKLLFAGNAAPHDIQAFCRHVILELRAPQASFDLLAPNAAEQLLFDRVVREVGAETYPNADRSRADVAAALIGSARGARQKALTVSRLELLRRARLRHDFGAVSRAHPVDPTLAVPRSRTVGDLARKVGEVAAHGGQLVISAPPGQGKSWIAEQLERQLRTDGWLVAEHYCFLGDADRHRTERVQGATILGSLLNQLSGLDPQAAAALQPRLAASEEALAAVLREVRRNAPDRHIALIVDGLDHVTRVSGAIVGRIDPAVLVAEELARIALPEGCALVVLSQPGSHLEALSVGPPFELGPFDREELTALSARVGVLCPSKSTDLPAQSDHERFIELLASRSAGNALQATYLCREVLRHPLIELSPLRALEALPDFGASLLAYYEYLLAGLDDMAVWVGELLALIRFSVTRHDLREIRPELGRRLDEVLDRLAPVLVDRSEQGGLRLYHESFARHLRQRADATSAPHILAHVIDWLQRRGMFQDLRAFAFLLELLHVAARHREVVELVDVDFVARAAAAGFSPSAMLSNVATAAGSAAALNDWPAVIMCVELARAARSYEYYGVETSFVQHATVAVGILGTARLEQTLLLEGRTTLAPRTGVLACGSVDAAGGVPPWREYLDAFERDEDRTSYDDDSNIAVGLAHLRGSLRVRDRAADEPSGSRPALAQRLADWLNESPELPAPAVVRVLVDVLDSRAVYDVLALLGRPAPFALALLRANAGAIGSEEFAKLTDLALREPPPGSAHALLAAGIPARRVVAAFPGAEASLIPLTRAVQRERLTDPVVVRRWLDAATLAARHDHVALAGAETAIAGEGWYPCWLQFVLALVRAEARPAEERSQKALDALSLLGGDTRPFHGHRRVVDLYGIHEEIRSTVARAIELLDGQTWLVGVQVVRDVAYATAVDLKGAMAGPLTFQVVLELIINSVARENASEAARILEEVIEHACDRRHYDDVARFELTAARFALRVDDHENARKHWQKANELLAAYGYRKDGTIYELIDALEHLVHEDAFGVRSRLGLLQQLCERVVLHTDGKGTWHARAAWWRLVAAADPGALAGLVVPAMFASCNEAHDTLDGARAALWRAQFTHADPLVAGALRLSINSPLDPHDPSSLERLAAIPDPVPPIKRDLLVSLVAQVDERHRTHGVSNDAELLADDDRIVERINAIGVANNLPLVAAPLLRADGRATMHSEPRDEETGGRQWLDRMVVPQFPEGALGLMRAVRDWHEASRQDGRTDARDRFANAIGYRLLVAVNEGLVIDAELAVRALAANGFGADARLAVLDDLSAGLALRGLNSLAAIAGALRWTATRGGGGWDSFGGETALESLGRAIAADRDEAMRVVGQEVQGVILRDTSPLSGITASVSLALARFQPLGSPGARMSFECWDAAAQVISRRLPRVADSDEPLTPYDHAATEGADPGVTVDLALATAAVAGLARPSREQKRRGLIAVRVIATARPDLMGTALRPALVHCSDPLSLSWLLATMLQLPLVTRRALVYSCRRELAMLCAKDELSTRSLARELLDGFGEAPSCVHAGNVSIPVVPTPRRAGDSAVDRRVARYAAQRLARAEMLVPGLTRAVDFSAQVALGTEAHRERWSRQGRALASITRDREPDAILDVQEVVERCVQRAAGGARASFAASGFVLIDPVGFERTVARAIMSDNRLPIALEHQRQPRPAYELPPAPGDPLLSPRQHSRAFATVVRQHAVGAAPREPSGPYRGWPWIGWFESRETWSSVGADRRGTVHHRYSAIASRRRRAGEPLLIGGCDARDWIEPIEIGSPAGSLRGTQLVSIDLSNECAELRVGLGLPTHVMVPHRLLVAALALQPRGELALHDRLGLAVVGLTWRAAYEHSSYELSFPLLAGMRVLIRPDLLDRACALLGGRPVWRECVFPLPTIRARSGRKPRGSRTTL